MTAKSNILEGLHVLLVSEDEDRISSLARALRDCKASVGDVKAQSRESLQLRGADLVVVDTRSLEATRARVNDMRSDVRARWASVAQLDYARLVLDDGAVMIAELETAVAPLVAADKELTERARREESFEVSLRPLGPSRMLRALAAAGPTMHVEMFHETLSGVVDLSNELLVCAFAERGTSEKWEAWTALVRILGLIDATVRISRRSHPAAMNIMEPIDQALEVAAQERHSSAALIALEERTARARVADDGARTGAHPAMRPDGTVVGFDPEADKPQLSPEKLAPKRTLLGVAPPMEARASQARPPAQSRYAYHADPSHDKVAPMRTLLGVAPGALPGVAPGALPAFGGVPRPPVPIPVPQLTKLPGDIRPANDGRRVPAFAKAAPDSAAPAGPLAPFVEEVPTDKHPIMLEVARAAFAESEGQDHLALQHAATRPIGITPDPDREPTGETAVTVVNAHESVPGEDQATVVGDANEMLALREAAANDATDDSGLPGAIGSEPPAFGLGPGLLAAISEEVETAVFSGPPGARPMETTLRKVAAVPQMVTRLARGPRTRALLLILLGAVIEFYIVTWVNGRNDELVTQSPAAAAPLPQVPAPGLGPKPAEAQSARSPVLPTQDVASATPEPGATPGATGVEPTAETPAPTSATPREENSVDTATERLPEPAPEKGDPDEVNGSVDDYVRNGMKLLASGDTARALDEFARAVAADARNAHARCGLAEALLALRRPQDALAQIDAAIKLRPKRAHYRVVQGDVLQALGKQSQAREAWERALEIDSSDDEPKRRLGR